MQEFPICPVAMLHGFDAQTEDYGDLMKLGIIDPTKVVRTALQDAASVAGLIVTTERRSPSFRRRKLRCSRRAQGWITEAPHLPRRVPRRARRWSIVQSLGIVVQRRRLDCRRCFRWRRVSTQPGQREILHPGRNRRRKTRKGKMRLGPSQPLFPSIFRTASFTI